MFTSTSYPSTEAPQSQLHRIRRVAAWVRRNYLAILSVIPLLADSLD